MAHKILVIDDDQNLLTSIKKILKLNNYLVDTLSNSTQVEEVIKNQSYHCILLDVKMPGINGIDVLHHISQKYPSIPVIMISGQSNIEIAVKTIKDGAFDFIEKPIDPERLIITIKNALSKYDLVEAKDNIYKELQDKFRLVGNSPALAKIIQQIQQVAKTSAKVLIEGESGTGKELVAWAIHHSSNRAGKPYIRLNCASVPADLLESQLFGHKKGSFTGAIADHQGKFLAAQGGSLFLDEISDMDMYLQAKLLRVVEENEVEIIGENVPQKLDVRIIAATNKNLHQMVKEGKFREDLFHRLNVVKIVIPPLRNRKSDILPLAYHFLSQFNSAYNKQILTISRQAEAILLNHAWKGNARELRNIIEKIVVFSNKKEISINDIQRALEIENLRNPEVLKIIDKPMPLKNAGFEFEKQYIILTLQKNNWKIQKTAKALGVNRSNLYKKMKKFGILKT